MVSVRDGSPKTVSDKSGADKSGTA